jgi:hypothetical protein
VTSEADPLFHARGSEAQPRLEYPATFVGSMDVWTLQAASRVTDREQCLPEEAT